MGGFNQQSLVSRIGDLRQNVQEKYTNDSSVLKELLQNADDAKAQELDVALLDSIDGCNHPLLGGPTLVVVNDGPFTPDNAYGIRQMSGGSKADDPDAIGRFGLGLKSVFRLTELIIHATARPDPVHVYDEVEGPADGVIHPWHGFTPRTRFGLTDAHRRELERRGGWSDLPPGDAERLKSLAAFFAGEGADPAVSRFLLALPLRLSRNVHDASLQLTDDTFDDPAALRASLLGDQSVELLATTLPMLRCVQAVRLWRGTARQPELFAALSVAGGSGRLRGLATVEGGRASSTDFVGRVLRVDMGGPVDGTIRGYVGHQRRCDTAGFPDPASFPAAASVLRTGNRSGAVVILHRPAANPHRGGQITARRAVFLPLSEDPIFLGHTEQPHDVEVLFHGTFFPDSGRQGVEVAAADADPLQVRPALRWNRAVLRRACLPATVPALAAFAAGKGDGLTSTQRKKLVADLTRALRSPGSPLTGHIDAACAEVGWGLRADDGKATYRIIPRERRVLLVPPVPPKVGAATLWPDLGRLLASPDGGTPRLLAVAALGLLHPHQELRWSTTDAAAFLEGLDAEAVLAGSASGLRWLAAWIDDLKPVLTHHEVEDALVAFCLRLLRTPTPERLRHALGELREVLAFLPATRVRTLPRVSPVALCDRWIHRLGAACDTTVLLAEDLYPHEGAACMAPAEVHPLLEELALDDPPGGLADRAGAEQLDRTRFKLAASLVEAALAGCDEAERPETLRAALGDLPIVLCRRAGRPASLEPLSTLLDAAAGECLFRASVASTLEVDLQAAVDAPIFAFTGDERQAAGWLEVVLGRQLTTTTARSAARTVEVSVVVADAAKRASLLEAFLRERDGADLLDAARKLLGGNQVTRDTLLLQPGGGATASAEALLAALSAVAKAAGGGPPRLVPVDSELASRLNELQQKQHRVEALSVPVVARWWILSRQRLPGLRSREVRFEPGPLSDPAAARACVTAWPAGEEAEAALRKLALFEGTGGQLHAVDEATHADIGGDNSTVPSGLPVVLLRTPPEPAGYADRVRRLAPPMEARHAVGHALSAEEPHRFFAFLLRQLHSLSPKSCSQDLLTRVREIPWVPTNGGRIVAPNRLVDLPPAAAEALPEEVREGVSLLTSVMSDGGHGEAALRPWLAPPAAQMQTLGNAFVAAGLGGGTAMTRLTNDSKELDLWIRVFTAEDARDAQPLAGVMRPINDSEKRKALARTAAAKMPRERLTQVCEALEAAHSGQDFSKERPAVLGLFLDILKEGLGEQEERKALLESLRVPNDNGLWESLSRLAPSDDNIPPAQRIHRQVDEVLEQLLGRPDGPGAASDGQGPTRIATGNSKDALDAAEREGQKAFVGLLREWEEAGVDPEMSGLLLAALGDHGGFRQAAERCLGSLGIARERLGTGFRPGMGLDDFDAAMQKCRFVLTPAETGVRVVTNYLGGSHSFKVDGEVSSFFEVPHRQSYEILGQHRVFRVDLRVAHPPENREPDAGVVRRIWLGSLSTLLRRCFGSLLDEDALSPLIDKLADPAQSDLDTARRVVRREAIGRLHEQLKLSHESFIRGRLMELRTLSRDLSSAESVGSNSEVVRLRERAEAALDDVVTGLERDADTQAAVLDAVRLKLDQNSYDRTSVAFELFQNADDARGEATELGLMQAGECGGFVAAEDPDGWLFAHAGRPINHSRSRGSQGADKPQAHFRHDLANMLSLGASDKDPGQPGGSPTGHFGLGFKSVFFLTDRPRVLSGRRMAFEVLAGVLPVALDDTVREDLRLRAQAVLPALGAPQAAQVTAILLPRRAPDGSVDDGEVLGPFAAAAPLLPVFARHLSRIEVRPAGHSKVVYTREPRARWRRDGVTVCLHPTAGTGLLMVARDEDDPHAAVALRVQDAEVATRRSDDLPAVWVTVPTRERLAGGLIVNAMFDLNPGRTQLRSSERNATEADRLVPLLAGLLSAAAASLCGEGPLAPFLLGDRTPASRERVLKNLGELAAAYCETPLFDEAAGVLHRVAFGAGEASFSGGFGVFFRAGENFPTDMGAGWQAAVNAAESRHHTEGALLCNHGVQEAVAPLLQSTPEAATVLSRTVTSKKAKLLQSAGKATEPLTLSAALAPVVASLEERWMPFAAEAFGAVLRAAQKVPEGREELASLRKHLSGFSWQTRGQGWEAAGRLAVPQLPNGDETLLAGFAPDEHLPAAAYTSNALHLAAWVRGEERPEPELVAAWIAGAHTPEAQTAALAWLSEAARARPVLAILRKGGDGWWSDLEVNDERWGGLDETQRSALSGPLGVRDFVLQEAEKLGWLDTSTKSETLRQVPGVNHASCCQAIADWVGEHRAELSSAYDAWVYPPGGVPALSREDEDTPRLANTAVRRAWMTLLIRGSLFRMGRTRNEQHREFLTQRDTRGTPWLDTFSAPEPADNFERWGDLLRDHIRERKAHGGDYAFWLRNVVDVYALALDLEGHVRVLLSLTRRGVDWDRVHPDHLLDPAAASHLSGSGIESSPLTHVLGCGAGFVIRELFRLGIYDAAEQAPLVPYAFCNVKAVRDRVSEATGWSLDGDHDPVSDGIFNALALHLENEHSGVHMHGLFDVPFAMLGAGSQPHRAVAPLVALIRQKLHSDSE